MTSEDESLGKCVFHVTNEATAKCAECGLAICDLDQDYNLKQERICPICANRYKAKKFLRLINYGLYGSLIAIFVVMLVMKLGWTYYFIPILLLLLAPYIMRPLIIKFYFQGLEPIQIILPLIKYFEISGNEQYYKLFLKNIKQLEEQDIASIRNTILEYLIPALALNFAILPENWEQEVSNVLKLDLKDFQSIMVSEYKNVLIQTAVHAAHPDISKFMIYLAEETGDKDILKDYIKEICSDEILSLSEKELNTIYKNLLEELYLYDDTFYSLCDELGLVEEKEKIKLLIEKFVPPPVPKNQFEAVLPPQQLEERRRIEKLKAEMAEKEEEEKEIEEVKFENE